MTPAKDKSPKSAATSARGHQLSAAMQCSPLQPAIFDQLLDSILVTDLNGNITACNKGVRMFDYVPEELAGKNMSGLFRPEEQAIIQRQVIPFVLEKGRFEGEIR